MHRRQTVKTCLLCGFQYSMTQTCLFSYLRHITILTGKYLIRNKLSSFLVIRITPQIGKLFGIGQSKLFGIGQTIELTM
jgi:hypothetical protein